MSEPRPLFSWTYDHVQYRAVATSRKSAEVQWLFILGDGLPGEWRKSVDAGATIAGMLSLLSQRETLAHGINAVGELIAGSRGVVGLHLNGEEAPWAELLEGGQFETWLGAGSRAAPIAKKVEEQGGGA